MRYVRFIFEGRKMLGHIDGDGIRVLGEEPIEALLSAGTDLREYTGGGAPAGLIPRDAVSFLPVLERPPKILCVGLNYAEHTAETRFEQPAYPTIFTRFHTSLVGQGQPIICPEASGSLDFEGELAVILKQGGRHITKEDAGACVAGYALFNDASVRDYQFLSSQWTMGKNFDATGAFGPELVTADELPLFARGLQLETRLNGTLVQSASTDDMIFDIPCLISLISEVISLEPGDVIVTGTPSGIGWAREPKLYMKPGDVCEVSLTGFTTLRNTVAAER